MSEASEEPSQEEARGICAVIGGVVAPPPLSVIQALARQSLGPSAEVTLLDGSEADWRALALRGEGGGLRLSRLAPGERLLIRQIQALTTFAIQAEGGTTDRALLVAQRLAGAHDLIGVAATGGDPAWEPLARGLAQQLNGLVFQGGRLLDHELRPLIVAGGAPDPRAVLPVLPDALERCQRSERRIELFDLQPPPLPPLPSVEEVQPRSARAVAERAQALWAVAARAAGLGAQAARDLLEQRGLGAAATPREKEYLAAEVPAPEQVARQAHRVEALRALLWALGKVELLGPPRHAAELDELSPVLRRHAAQAFCADARLRPLAELLEEACVLARCHAALLRRARAGQGPPKGLLPEVVAERHAALTWVLGTPRVAWDELWSPPGAAAPESPPTPVD
ncbi:MAG: DUF4272 domain-containing protein [Planctomycetota bacterium]